MLSCRGLPIPPLTVADPDDGSSSFLGMTVAGTGDEEASAAVTTAAPAVGFGVSAGSAFVPGLDMFPLQLAFMPSVPRTHLSTMAEAFLLDTSPNLGGRGGGEERRGGQHNKIIKTAHLLGDKQNDKAWKIYMATTLGTREFGIQIVVLL